MKAIVLDMYGVIMKQTGDDYVPYIRRTFPDLSSEEIYTPWLKADAGELNSLEVWKALGFKGDLEKIEKEYLDTIEINEGFYDFISDAKSSYKLAIISNDSSEWSQYLRNKFDINKFFDVISISGDLKIRKPDEQIFRKTIAELGCTASDCLYVDDRSGNLSAAERLGMNTVLFKSRHIQYDGRIVNGFQELSNMLIQ